MAREEIIYKTQAVKLTRSYKEEIVRPELQREYCLLLLSQSVGTLLANEGWLLLHLRFILPTLRNPHFAQWPFTSEALP
jgi:hypothetical protein